MTIIKCPECQKEISDESKSCTHCGYPLKKNNKTTKKNIIDSVFAAFKTNKEYSFIKNKIRLSSLQILALVSLICSYIMNISERCFFRKVYPNGQGVPSQVLLENFKWTLLENESYAFVWYIMLIFMVLNVVSIILYDTKLNKFKKKSYIYFPNIAYVITIMMAIFLSLSGKLTITKYAGYVRFYISWGAILVLILSIVSGAFLLFDLEKHKKAQDINQAKIVNENINKKALL